MTLGRQDCSVTRIDSGAHVFRLAGFFRDDDLIDHDWLGWTDRFGAAELEHIGNTMASQGDGSTFSGVGASDQPGEVQGLGARRKARRGLDSLVGGLTV